LADFLNRVPHRRLEFAVPNAVRDISNVVHQIGDAVAVYVADRNARVAEHRGSAKRGEPAAAVVQVDLGIIGLQGHYHDIGMAVAVEIASGYEVVVPTGGWISDGCLERAVTVPEDHHKTGGGAWAVSQKGTCEVQVSVSVEVGCNDATELRPESCIRGGEDARIKDPAALTCEQTDASASNASDVRDPVTVEVPKHNFGSIRYNSAAMMLL
jgi:hypothetical protein